eukprot:TRINITY_DN3969_c0_g2_i1.p1 TRINITY_DN3969_c0_g2~~TRINITY_DN3969_c0_g2_i1.p1  ORF type:complete len:324 (-),score=113.86 TRINITY_DN3969_c0_g2_i1:137-1108(-)
MKSFAFALVVLAVLTVAFCDDANRAAASTSTTASSGGAAAAASAASAASGLEDLLEGLLDFKGLLTKKTATWKKAVKSVYNMTIWPNNEYYIKGGKLPNVLSTKICGRVHPFGKHCEPLGVAEYFYGLTPNNITFDTFPSVFILDVMMTKFFVDVETKTAFSTINYVCGPLNRAYIINATQVGTFRFDKDDKIVEFDLWNPLYSANTRRGINYSDPTYRATLYNQTCDRHSRFCVGPNKQYESVAACVNFLKTIPFGEPDVFTANNVLCRNQHATLIQLRPEVHCAHIGPTGGDFCRDEPFNDFFQVPYFTDKNRLVAPMVTY